MVEELKEFFRRFSRNFLENFQTKRFAAFAQTGLIVETGDEQRREERRALLERKIRRELFENRRKISIDLVVFLPTKQIEETRPRHIGDERFEFVHRGEIRQFQLNSFEQFVVRARGEFFEEKNQMTFLHLKEEEEEIYSRRFKRRDRRIWKIFSIGETKNEGTTFWASGQLGFNFFLVLLIDFFDFLR